MQVWSRDDRTLFFASDRSGTAQVFRRLANLSSDEEPLGLGPAEDVPLDVSPDGRYLLFSRAATRQTEDLWVMPLSGSAAEPVALLRTPARETQARFSPDGRHIVYVSNESGAPEVYVRPFADGTVGAPQLAPEVGGSQPLWPNPNELFYLRADSTAMLVPVRTTSSIERGATQALFRVPLYGTGNPQIFSRWDVIGDGKRFMAITIDDRVVPQHIAMVLNWPALLAR